MSERIRVRVYITLDHKLIALAGASANFRPRGDAFFSSRTFTSLSALFRFLQDNNCEVVLTEWQWDAAAGEEWLKSGCKVVNQLQGNAVMPAARLQDALQKLSAAICDVECELRQ
jgi:hypothetical protein